MRLRPYEVFADALAIWRSGREALLPVAAIFFFLPALANLLFVPALDLTNVEVQARTAAMANYFVDHFGWYAGQFVVESIGVGTVLLMLLDPARPSVGEAMSGALRRLPGLMAARFFVSAAVLGGMFLLVLPGLFLMARTFLTSAIYIAEPQRGPIGAPLTAFERTRGHGLTMFVLIFSASAVSNVLGGGIVLQLAYAAEPLGPMISGPLKALGAVVIGGGMLLAVLLEAAAYRALPPRTGT